MCPLRRPGRMLIVVSAPMTTAPLGSSGSSRLKEHYSWESATVGFFRSAADEVSILSAHLSSMDHNVRAPRAVCPEVRCGDYVVHLPNSWTMARLWQSAGWSANCLVKTVTVSWAMFVMTVDVCPYQRRDRKVLFGNGYITSVLKTVLWWSAMSLVGSLCSSVLDVTGSRHGPLMAVQNSPCMVLEVHQCLRVMCWSRVSASGTIVTRLQAVVCTRFHKVDLTVDLNGQRVPHTSCLSTLMY